MLSQSAPKQPLRPAAAEHPGNYNGIDLIKFICSILIVVIHIPPFQGRISAAEESVNFWLQHYLCRVAVPFYFVCAGFFLFRNMSFRELNTERLRNYCFKILRLIGIWSILLFAGKTVHLWYLRATVVAVCLLWICLRLGIRPRYICVLACLLYGIGLLGDSYYGLSAPLAGHPVLRLISKCYGLFFQTTRNGVFMGFIFLFMGAALAEYRVRLRPLPVLTGFLTSMVGLLAEVYLLERNRIPADHNMYIFLLPAVFFLFLLARSLRLKDRPVYRRLRCIGILIYFTHMLADHCVTIAVSVCSNHWGIDLNPFRFILSLLSTLLLAVCIDWLSQRDRFRFLRWLVS